MKRFLPRPLGSLSWRQATLYVLSVFLLTSSLSVVFIQTPTQTASAENHPPPPVQVIEPAPVPAPNSETGDPALTDKTSRATQLGKVVKRIPVYHSYDYLTGYLNNRTYPVIVDGKPWINAATNVAQYQQSEGGTSFWDYWGPTEDWESPNHMWQDDNGVWHLYKKQPVTASDGSAKTGYVLVDRDGPGVMDKLWFTHDAATTFLLRVFNVTPSFDPAELTQWGNLSRLGNLRIEVDNRVVYDGPIKDWFTGKAQHLSSDLAKIFVWRYQDFGSEGNIIPIPYQDHLKVLVYGGTSKPKWFMATGVTLPRDTRVRAYTGSDNDLPLETMTRLARNVLMPEKYIDTFDDLQVRELNIRSGAPSTLEFAGVGTVEALQIKIQKKYDPTKVMMKVKYGDTLGINLPLVAFFGEPDQISLHHSTPLGIIEQGDSYLFYSNYPMPLSGRDDHRIFHRQRAADDDGTRRHTE